MAFLREHILPDVRVPYAIDNAGGSATNIIQPEASVSYQIRAPKIAQVQELAERIEKLARGAAMMTETEVDVQFQRATSELRVNETVNDVIFEYLQAFGATEATAEDLALAGQLYEAIPEKNRGGTAVAICLYLPGADEAAYTAQAIGELRYNSCSISFRRTNTPNAATELSSVAAFFAFGALFGPFLPE